MPPSHQPKAQPVPDRLDDISLYPPQALEFVEEGLRHTVHLMHGHVKDPNASRHVSGQQLCEGLRDLALARWGRLARTVLRRWNITSTFDFGRIVFALIAAGQMQQTEEDSIEDFRGVFEFRTAFESDYRIPTA